jgi:hypothetical protein
MLPRADVEVFYSIDYDKLRTPSNDDIEFGAFGTREYSADFLLSAEWDDVTPTLEYERTTIDEVAKRAGSAEEFDELLADAEDGVLFDENEGFVRALDLGVTAAALALCAAGCFTFASCRGHVGATAWAEWPLILFLGDTRRARVVERAARSSGCGLANNNGGLVSTPAEN